MTDPTNLPPLPKPTWTPTNRTAGYAWSEDDMHAYAAPLLARIAELEAQLADEREDAQRYRWLRDTNDAMWRPFGLRHGGDAAKADAAIDAAIHSNTAAGEQAQEAPKS